MEMIFATFVLLLTWPLSAPTELSNQGKKSHAALLDMMMKAVYVLSHRIQANPLAELML
ncbi:hypothetical protein EMCG_04421 [[Emmonsia] crescens]|uniref:Uncharacterized protein n=1 Tax=[Emmonsia] crescens TaxID=73230 RepID=A0A0G2HSG4_9EURO|nr:hypothetical protein EMCG_04421 [Emmonsia crescens UAMH 3008]